MGSTCRFSAALRPELDKEQKRRFWTRRLLVDFVSLCENNSTNETEGFARLRSCQERHQLIAPGRARARVIPLYSELVAVLLLDSDFFESDFFESFDSGFGSPPSLALFFFAP
jgi:hypothetical protein